MGLVMDLYVTSIVFFCFIHVVSCVLYVDGSGVKRLYVVCLD